MIVLESWRPLAVARRRVRTVGLVACALIATAGVAGAVAPGAPPAAGHPEHSLDPQSSLPRMESNVAVDPRDPRRVVTVAIQMGYPFVTAATSTGYKPQDMVWVSADGGASYQRGGALPEVNPADPSGNDPTLAWDPHGPLYASYSTFYSSAGHNNDTSAGVYVARSDDGGRHFRRLGRLEGFHCSGPDRSTVAVDPVRGWVYVVWTHYEESGCNGSPDLTKTVLRWARSTDGGRHFSAPVSFTQPGGGVMPALAVLPSGTLVVTYNAGSPNDLAGPCHGFESHIVAARWDLRGHYLGTTAAIPDMCEAFADVSPNGAFYVLNTYPEVAADPATGHLLLAASFTSQTQQGIMTATSSDAGRTWAQSLVTGLPGSTGMMPALGFGPPGGARGLAALAWLEVDPSGVYRPMLVASTDFGQHFGAAVSLASVPSAGNAHPYGVEGYEIGHYMGVAVGSDGVAHVAWPDVRPRGATTGDVDIWVRDVPLR